MKMPTPKATHIAKPLVPTLNPKLVKECVFPNAPEKKARAYNTELIVIKVVKERGLSMLSKSEASPYILTLILSFVLSD
jgi:hypothetical protein